RQSNLSRDLTASLKGRVTDPGEVVLRPGTVRNPGPNTKPPAKLDADAVRLGAALLKAPSDQLDEMLVKYRDTPGVVYTQALASAIPQLGDDAKRKARLALAERLARMTANTLRSRFRDEDLEIRRAAALACAMKADISHVPDLIALLEDAEPLVSRAAHAALKDMPKGKDFGPLPDATSAERKEAVKAWQTWWRNQQDK